MTKIRRLAFQLLAASIVLPAVLGILLLIHIHWNYGRRGLHFEGKFLTAPVIGLGALGGFLASLALALYVVSLVKEPAPSAGWRYLEAVAFVLPLAIVYVIARVMLSHMPWLL
jgi:hypothetical protein